MAHSPTPVSPFPLPARSVVITWAAALAFTAILIGGWLHTKATIQSQLNDHVTAMSQLATDSTRLTFDDIEKSLKSVGDTLQVLNFDSPRGLTSQQRMMLQMILIRARGRSSSLVSVTVLDNAGEVVAGSPFHGQTPSSHPPKELASTVRDEHGELVVSDPFRINDTGPWLVRIQQRITDAENTAKGTLVADVAIDDALARFFAQYSFADGDFVALQDAAHRRLAYFAADSQEGNRSDVATLDSAVLLDDGVHRLEAPNQAGEWLVSAHKLPRYPFYVIYGKNIDSWLWKWRQEQFLLAVAVLAAILVTTVIAAGIQRRYTLTRQLQIVRGDLEESNAALRQTLAKAEMLAAKDQMTGLLNRHSFDRQLEATIARVARNGDTFSLLMIDIDHFKSINDYYGHTTGDDVLKRFGTALLDRLRQYDVAARWGGEEFSVLADGTSIENARLLAESIRESISDTPFTPVPRVTISIGVAEYHPGESGDDLLKRADKALYGAKRNGRNRVIAAESPQLLKRQTA